MAVGYWLLTTSRYVVDTHWADLVQDLWVWPCYLQVCIFSFVTKTSLWTPVSDKLKYCRGSVAQGQSLALAEVVLHETLCLFRQLSGKLSALIVSRRNVPNIFAHAPQFTRLRIVHKKRTLYGSNFFALSLITITPYWWPVDGHLGPLTGRHDVILLHCHCPPYNTDGLLMGTMYLDLLTGRHHVQEWPTR